MMTAALPKSYVPSEHEPTVREKWELSGAFHAEPDDPREPYCILIPPPNVTAALHLGHALNNTLQDVLTRYHRMRGYNTLWMPGTDHAGIATQAVVEKRLMAEGKRRSDFTREAFVDLVQRWKDEYEATITEQLKAMGCSCDWERQRFTMDAMCAKAVREAFFRLFKDGLIYRGKRLVNWDPVTLTALADDEVEMEEVAGKMYYLRYPLSDDSGETITVATTRPETMLGDTAVAINPRDPRADAFVGRSVRLPIVGREIPIIGDDYVVRPVAFGGDGGDPKAAFATGFLKVTPAHDPNDWEIGRRHDLPVVNVLAPDASISSEHGWDDFAASRDRDGADRAMLDSLLGVAREDARQRIVEWFSEHGLLETVKDYTHSVGHSYRSHVPIEPYLSDQWYVKVTDDRLVGEAQRALPGGTGILPGGTGKMPVPPSDGDGALCFFPERYAKTYSAWHENLRDWCISRQLWWGHRIPVWHKRVHLTEENFADELLAWGWDSFVQGHWSDQGAFARIVRVADGAIIDPAHDALNPVVKETECEYDIYICLLDEDHRPEDFESHGFEQDPDVLDTWFSSGLWPLSTMGWPDPAAYPETEGLLDTFNPTSVLCTGRDIITLWVSRMVMFNRYFTEDHRVPFRHVYINPMIQDGHGQRMSKSLGNGVDPRDIIHSHGADALRYALVQLATSTQDVRLPVDMICPHCGHTFEPKEIASSAGYRVAAPKQTCPACGKAMVSAYGLASGDVREATADMPLARNASARFDLGRNFCNKLWNATRFALSNLNVQGEHAVGLSDLALPDRWIIARLHRGLHRIEDALETYQFNTYAETMYDFLWRDFCDWYLEAIKPTVRDNPPQQQVLRTVLDAAIRLLHPICPFVTEALWPHIVATGRSGIEGIELGEADLLAAAPWPDIRCAVDDREAHDRFEHLRDLVETIRTIRGEQRLHDRERITLVADGSLAGIIESASPIVETLAGLGEVARREGAALPDGAIPFRFGEGEHAIILPREEIDPEALRFRLNDEIGRLERKITALEGRLANPGYTQKAPAHLVQETRDELAAAAADRDLKRKALDELDDDRG